MFHWEPLGRHAVRRTLAQRPVVTNTDSSSPVEGAGGHIGICTGTWHPQTDVGIPCRRGMPFGHFVLGRDGSGFRTSTYYYAASVHHRPFAVYPLYGAEIQMDDQLPRYPDVPVEEEADYRFFHPSQEAAQTVAFYRVTTFPVEVCGAQSPETELLSPAPDVVSEEKSLDELYAAELTEEQKRETAFSGDLWSTISANNY